MIRWLLSLCLLVAPTSPALAQHADAVAWTGSVELPDGSALDFSVELTQDSGTITIPLQHAIDVPLSNVTVTDKELSFSIPAAGAVWDMKIAEDGQTATGVLTQGVEMKTTMKRLAKGESAHKELVRPQEPKPPFPYDASEVTFENAAAHVKLAGTLTVPRGAGPFPCVILVTGSGPQDRDEALMGHRPFLVIADHLTRHGIAVLRYDDRGFGKSTGKFAEATSDDFAQDALAAVAYARTRKEIDPKKIGIAGHSEGGLIAPLCAVQSKDVAFIVLLAGPGMNGAELIPLQSKLINLAQGMPAEHAEAQARDSAAIFALVLAGKSNQEIHDQIRISALRELQSAPDAHGSPPDDLTKKADAVADEQTGKVTSPWFKRFLTLDPRETLAKVTCPVLALNGEKDLQVPPKEDLAGIQSALQKGGNKDVTITELKGLNHLFQTAQTGSPSEYAKIEETFSPLALDAMTTWILKHTSQP